MECVAALTSAPTDLSEMEAKRQKTSHATDEAGIVPTTTMLDATLAFFGDSHFAWARADDSKTVAVRSRVQWGPSPFQEGGNLYKNNATA